MPNAHLVIAPRTQFLSLPGSTTEQENGSSDFVHRCTQRFPRSIPTQRTTTKYSRRSENVGGTRWQDVWSDKSDVGQEHEQQRLAGREPGWRRCVAVTASSRGRQSSAPWFTVRRFAQSEAQENRRARASSLSFFLCYPSGPT